MASPEKRCESTGSRQEMYATVPSLKTVGFFGRCQTLHQSDRFCTILCWRFIVRYKNRTDREKLRVCDSKRKSGRRAFLIPVLRSWDRLASIDVTDYSC
jgi:hypothetical protein